MAQRCMAAMGLIVLAPFMGAIAIAVRLTSPGPALFRGARAAPLGTFRILKFRTMAEEASQGIPITAAGDPRVTPVGRVLRRTKLDELPQLVNVVRGEMALVGPRPEDPRYVDWSDPIHRVVFGVRPGITGPAALAFRDEEVVLAREAGLIARRAGRDRATREDIERAYREVLLPAKLALEAEYLRTRTVRGDLAILGRTIEEVLRRTARS